VSAGESDEARGRALLVILGQHPNKLTSPQPNSSLQWWEAAPDLPPTMQSVPARLMKIHFGAGSGSGLPCS
jgi:hypothetical protein